MQSTNQGCHMSSAPTSLSRRNAGVGDTHLGQHAYRGESKSLAISFRRPACLHLHAREMKFLRIEGFAEIAQNGSKPTEIKHISELVPDKSSIMAQRSVPSLAAWRQLAESQGGKVKSARDS
jgi:hypothetical protein